MFNTMLTESEIHYRQHQVRAGYIQAQRQVSIGGIRQILGNTVIAMGSRIHGMAQDSCTDAAEIRSMVRNAARTALPLKSGG